MREEAEISPELKAAQREKILASAEAMRLEGLLAAAEASARKIESEEVITKAALNTVLQSLEASQALIKANAAAGQAGKAATMANANVVTAEAAKAAKEAAGEKVTEVEEVNLSLAQRNENEAIAVRKIAEANKQKAAEVASSAASAIASLKKAAEEAEEKGNPAAAQLKAAAEAAGQGKLVAEALAKNKEAELTAAKKAVEETKKQLEASKAAYALAHAKEKQVREKEAVAPGRINELLAKCEIFPELVASSKSAGEDLATTTKSLKSQVSLMLNEFSADYPGIPAIDLNDASSAQKLREASTNQNKEIAAFASAVLNISGKLDKYAELCYHGHDKDARNALKGCVGAVVAFGAAAAAVSAIPVAVAILGGLGVASAVAGVAIASVKHVKNFTAEAQLSHAKQIGKAVANKRPSSPSL